MKSRDQLEAELLALTREIEELHRSVPGDLIDARRRMAETLHNLQVHQEELRTQNDELRQAQDNLEKIGNRYRDLFEYSPVGYFILNGDLVVADANITAMGMLGRTKRRVVGKPLLLFVEKDDRPGLDRHFQRVRADGRASSELWLSPDRAAPFPVILESVRLGEEWGGGWHCLTTAQDITGRMRAEEAVRGSEARFRAIFEQSPLAIQIVDGSGVAHMSNRAWVKLWGPDSTAAGRPVATLPGAQRLVAEGLAGHTMEIPAISIAADGAERWVHGYGYPIRGQHDAVEEVVLVHEDITERKRVELALAERSERLARQHQNLRVLGEIAAVPSTASRRLAEALDMGRRHLGLASGMIARVEGSRLTVEYHSADPGGELAEGASFDRAASQCALAIERDDVVAIAHWAASPHADHPGYRSQGLESFIGAPIRAHGRVHGTVSFSSVTPYHRDFDEGDAKFMRLLARWIGAVLEEDAIRRDLARSNAELEQFAYVASHDLRQPLRQVSSYVTLLERRYADQLDDVAREFIAFAREGATRMDDLIVDLLELSRIGRDAKPMGPVPLAEVVERAVATLGLAIAEAGGRVEVVGALPVVTGDASDLLRLFQNLIGNAIKYRLPDRPPVVTVSARSGPAVHVVTVADNGIGIAPEYFDTIFGVFKRLHTIAEYEGTGIGLAICKKVIERHHGRIWVESIPGEGSVFHLDLPTDGSSGG